MGELPTGVSPVTTRQEVERHRCGIVGEGWQYCTMLWTVTICWCLLALVHCVLPCNNFKLKVNHIKNCKEGKRDLIRPRNLTVSLTEGCDLVPRGCLEVKKPLARTTVEWRLNSRVLKKNGEIDMCKMLEKPDVQAKVKEYKLPPNCTIPARVWCVKSGSEDLTRVKGHLHLFRGQTTALLKMQHNDGGRSCLDISIQLEENKKRSRA